MSGVEIALAVLGALPVLTWARDEWRQMNQVGVMTHTVFRTALQSVVLNSSQCLATLREVDVTLKNEKGQAVPSKDLAYQYYLRSTALLLRMNLLAYTFHSQFKDEVFKASFYPSGHLQAGHPRLSNVGLLKKKSSDLAKLTKDSVKRHTKTASKTMRRITGAGTKVRTGPKLSLAKQQALQQEAEKVKRWLKEEEGKNTLGALFNDECNEITLELQRNSEFLLKLLNKLLSKGKFSTPYEFAAESVKQYVDLIVEGAAKDVLLNSIDSVHGLFLDMNDAVSFSDGKIQPAPRLLLTEMDMIGEMQKKLRILS